jgi:hypothetical protein
MTLFARIVRFIGLAPLASVRRFPDIELALADSWVGEDQWLAGMPHPWNEPVGWRWWHSQ